MGWNRQPAMRVEPPAPLVLGRWFVAALIAAGLGVGLFFLRAADGMPALHALNVWALALCPLFVWLLAFAARAYFYGSALGRHAFLEAEAQVAARAWEGWASRSFSVFANCVVLPDQVSAAALSRGAHGLPPRTKQARRIQGLPAGELARAQEALALLIGAIAASLEALPASVELRLRLVTDIAPERFDDLNGLWRRQWRSVTQRPLPTIVALESGLSYQHLEDGLEQAADGLELILVLQMEGEGEYSDGLAALLIGTDDSTRRLPMRVTGRLLRPMPLEMTRLESDLGLFLDTQVDARQAGGLLADSAAWQPLLGRIVPTAQAHGIAYPAERSQVIESLVGVPGPCSAWLMAALAVEMAQQHQAPWLVLVQDGERHWISSVQPRELKV